MRLLSNPLVFFSLLILCIFVFIAFLKDIKKSESSIISEWTRLKYLIYLIENKAKTPQKSLSPEDLKKLLQKKGFEPEVVRESDFGGIELQIRLSWDELGSLLSLFASKDISVKSFNAETSSEGKIFKVKMVVK